MEVVVNLVSWLTKSSIDPRVGKGGQRPLVGGYEYFEVNVDAGKAGDAGVPPTDAGSDSHGPPVGS